MRKILLPYFYLNSFIFFACSQTKNQPNNDSIQIKKVKDSAKTELSDSNQINQNTIIDSNSGFESTPDKTDSLLLYPFDLMAYKKAKGQSNSGNAVSKFYYFKPKKGIYWRFFLFRRSARDTSNTFYNIEWAPMIVTLKPPGKNYSKYLDPDEVLIAVSLRQNDPDLPGLSFIDTDSISLVKKLGKPDYYVNRNLVYLYQDRVLICKLSQQRIKYVNYVHLNRKYTPAEIPAELLKPARTIPGQGGE